MSDDFDVQNRRAPLDIRRCVKCCIPCSIFKIILWGIGLIFVIVMGLSWWLGAFSPRTNTTTTVDTVTTNSVDQTNNKVNGSIVKIEKKKWSPQWVHPCPQTSGYGYHPKMLGMQLILACPSQRQESR